MDIVAEEAYDPVSGLLTMLLATRMMCLGNVSVVILK